MAVLRVCFFFRRKAAEEKKGLGRIAERMLCSCKLRLRRGEPDGRLTQHPPSSSWPPSASCQRGILLASVGFMPAGPRLAATRAVLRVCFFFRRKAAEEKKGMGRTVLED